MLINKRESAGLKYLNDSKALVEYLNEIDDIYKIIKEYHPNKKRKILIVFDEMIAEILSNKKLNLIVTELFIRERKQNISLVCMKQSHFAVPKSVRLNSITHMLWKYQKKRASTNHI